MGIGQTSLLPAVEKVLLELFVGDFFRRQTTMLAQLDQHGQVGPDGTGTVVSKLEFSDKPMAQLLFFFILIILFVLPIKITKMIPSTDERRFRSTTRYGAYALYLPYIYGKSKGF